MARELGADSLRYLPIDSIARALNRPTDELCRACLTGHYPTAHGQQLYQIALAKAELVGEIDPTDSKSTRTYESPVVRS
jgi:amidophosphoribosyltransferase